VIGKRNLASQPPDRAGGAVPSDPNTVLSLRDEWLKEVGPVRPDYTTVVDGDRKFVEVSDSFCHLMGYRREELIGIRYDDLTALGTSDIPTVFRLFASLGYMHGLWMLVARTGATIIVRYEAWVRSDCYIESKMELVTSEAERVT
jgi:PAS domain S-box-containing protein